MQNAAQKKILTIFGVAAVAGVVLLLRLFTWRFEVERMAARAGEKKSALSGVEEQWRSIGNSIDEARREAKTLRTPSPSSSEVQELKNMIETSKDKSL